MKKIGECVLIFKDYINVIICIIAQVQLHVIKKYMKGSENLIYDERLFIK